MKISFITIHIGSNFGSTLQTIATYKTLKELGADPICVNYIPPRVTYRRYWSVARTSIFRFIRRIIFFPFLYEETQRFAQYLARHCKVSTPIYYEDNFEKKCPLADIYITGSDQVWNTTHNEGLDAHYFFENIKGKKIAYASSIGKSSLDNQELQWLKEYTNDYSSILVREKSAVEIFKCIGKQAEQVLDPTIMLNRKEWLPYASKRMVKEPYLFVYLPYNIADKKLCYQTARKISKKKNLKVISFSHSFYKDELADHTFIFSGPDDVLSLIYHADFVITNSFHGTAFSINLNRQFYTYMPSCFSTRINSIVNLCGLQNRVLYDVVKDNWESDTINYAPINEKLDIERKKSINYLRDALK